MPHIENHGVILGQRDTDYIAGSITGLPYEVRNPTGDWLSYLPPGEWQRNHIVDTMACVTFSALNSIETQLKFFGIEKEFSDRFTAIMSGTTKEGNYLFKVADSIRKDGLILEGDYSAPEHYTWDSYYTAPSIELINKAREFLTEYEVRYEFVPPVKEQLIYHLKHAPLQIVLPGHAVLNFFCEGDVIKYFDSYEPFLKQTGAVYQALKIILNKKDTMKLTRDDVELLYRLIFNRGADSGAQGYVGQDLSFVLKEFEKSEEYKNQTALVEAARHL